MPYSASRLTCFAMLSAMEEDLRSLVHMYIEGQADARELLGGVWKRCVDRQERDSGLRDESSPLMELLVYADFADLYHVCNANSRMLPQSLSQYLVSVTPALDRLVRIRNRVAHSRPLDHEDFSILIDTAEDFVKTQGTLWSTLRDTVSRLKTDPGFVLSLSIPAYEAGEAARHNLPIPDFDETGFIGRKRQVDQLVKLALGPYPVITLVGDGGIGKTALALKAAYDILDLDNCPFDAVVWTSSKTTPLTATEIRRVEGAISDSLGMFKNVADHLAGVETSNPMDEVLAYLGQFRILLILDNLETVLDEHIREFLRMLPTGSKVLITSRIGVGEIEYRLKVEQMDASDATRLLRALAKIRNIPTLAQATQEQLALYCDRMKANPGFIKWFVTAVQADCRPEDVLAKPDVFLDFCMSNVYNFLAEGSKKVLRTMLCLPGFHTQAELHYLTKMEVHNLQRAIQQLLTTNMVVMSSSPRGSTFETRYEVTELARTYLSRHHPMQSEEVNIIMGRRQKLVAAGDAVRADQERNPYSVNSVVRRTPGDLVVARYLMEALRAAKSERYDKAEDLIQKAKDLDPGYFEVHKVEAWVKTQTGNVSAAINAYEGAIELEPLSAPVRFLYAGFLMRLEDLEQAAKQLDAAAKLDPASLEIALEQVRIDLYLSRFESARMRLDNLLSRANKSAWEYRKLYNLHLQYFQRLADHVAVSCHDYAGALDYLQGLCDAFAECPTELVDARMRKPLQKAITIAEQCQDHVHGTEAEQRAATLLAHLAKSANTHPTVPLRIGARCTGSVGRLKLNRMFGFIDSDTGHELFFHVDDLVDPSEWRQMLPGRRVFFMIGSDSRGYRAICVGLEPDALPATGPRSHNMGNQTT